MSTYPPLEARVSALERRQIHLDARIEEVDITTSFKHHSEDMTASFKQVSDYFIKTDERLDNIEADITTIKATMATKEDLTALETRILATMATKEDLATMATKEDLATMATKEDLATMATK